MLPSHIEKLLKEQIAADLQIKGRKQREVTQAAAQKAIAGHGGNINSLLANEIGREIQQRAELIAASIRTVLERVRITPYSTLSADVESLFGLEFDRVTAEWRPQLVQAWTGGAGQIGAEPTDLQSKIDNWRLANLMDVKLLAASIMEPILNGNQISISMTGSQVGVLQTGEGSVSVGTIALSQPQATDLQKALAEIAAVLKNTSAVDEVKAAELQEVISDAQTALDKPMPNITKVRGLLTTVVSGVKGIASVTGAYNIIDAFLKAHGVDVLP